MRTVHRRLSTPSLLNDSNTAVSSLLRSGSVTVIPSLSPSRAPGPPVRVVPLRLAVLLLPLAVRTVERSCQWTQADEPRREPPGAQSQGTTSTGTEPKPPSVTGTCQPELSSTQCHGPAVDSEFGGVT